MCGYFHDWNERWDDLYLRSREELEGLEKAGSGSGPAEEYFRDLSRSVLDLVRLEESVGSGELFRRSPGSLQEMNEELFRWRTPDGYRNSWADPARAAEAFGTEAGSLLALLYYQARSRTAAAFSGRRFELAHVASMVVSSHEHIIAGDGISPEGLRDSVSKGMRSLSRAMNEFNVMASLDPEFRFYRNIIERASPGDPSCLYRYGCHVGEHELRTYDFISGYSRSGLEDVSSIMVEGFKRGFASEGKELPPGSSLMLQLPVGYERLAGILMGLLEKEGLSPVVTPPSPTSLNRQPGLDHRFDAAVWLEDDHIDERLSELDSILSKNSSLTDRMSGVLVMSFFGEKPFSPKNKPEAISPGQEEMKLYRKYQHGMMAVREKFMPRTEMSFTVISFPSPEIGERFEEIFEATLRMNSADNETHRKLQNALIRMLDGAEAIRIQGTGGNRTDLTVALQPNDDPSSMTIFRNCLADINIPVGEVFTSPRLAGTTGMLHVERVQLNRISFRDLEIEFRDGYTVDCTCGNFDSREEGTEFVRKHLFFPNERLPVGEFAIGTNTLAYEMAMKFGIMDLLPVLIIEKMGPHLAIGDTCYAHEEDHRICNPDGREVVARDNEKTLARGDDPEEAYTNTHIDISIPYHMIRIISAVFPDGRTLEIIRDGRFVPKELEELNRPIDRLGS